MGIKERLGLTKSPVQSDENVTKISDTELKHIVRETINTVKQKPAHPQDPKPAEAQFADLLLKRVPTLLSSSHKTEKDLRDSLVQLHKKQPSDISEIRKLLGLPEYKKTSTKNQKEESHEKKENQEIDISTSNRGGGFLDIKLKPAKVTTEDPSGLTTVPKKLDADNEDDDFQIGTDKHFDDLTIMLKGMRLKPTVLEVYSKEKSFPKEVNESIDQALTKAKLAVSKKPGLKTVKKDDVDIFVDTFLKEIPDGNVTTNIDKNKFISKLSSLPSVSSISSDEMRNIISSEDPTLASEPLRQKYPELSNVKLEDTLKETIGHLRKHGLKNNKAPAKIQFAEVYLKSVPELVDSSSLSDTELLVNLSDMYERVPKDGKEIKERLGLTKSPVQSDENVTKISDTELEHLVRETINTVKQKPAHPQDQKPAEAQFADLLLKRVPTLLSSSHKTEKDLRDSLVQLHKKQPSDISEIRKLLGLPEYKKTSTKNQKEESHEKKENQEIDISTSNRGGGFLDIKLKPAKVTTEDPSGLTTVPKKLDADNEDDDYQIGTDKHFDDLTIMLQGMRLKPTVLEVYSKEKSFPKEVNESIDQALTKAKLAVSK